MVEYLWLKSPREFQIYFVLLYSIELLESISRQNALNSTVAKSLPQKWVILPKSFV